MLLGHIPAGFPQDRLLDLISVWSVFVLDIVSSIVWFSELPGWSTCPACRCCQQPRWHGMLLSWPCPIPRIRPGLLGPMVLKMRGPHGAEIHRSRLCGLRFWVFSWSCGPCPHQTAQESGQEDGEKANGFGSSLPRTKSQVVWWFLTPRATLHESNMIESSNTSLWNHLQMADFPRGTISRKKLGNFDHFVEGTLVITSAGENHPPLGHWGLWAIGPLGRLRIGMMQNDPLAVWWTGWWQWHWGYHLNSSSRYNLVSIYRSIIS